MLVSTREFMNRLTESGLGLALPPETMAALLELPTAEAAARELIAKNLLTEFQARVIADGDRIPLVIGDYIVVGSLGRGGMGYVLKARHRRMKRDVAIKFLLKELTAADDAKRRFEREVEAAAQLNHQNIVTAYDAGEHTDGSCYLVMQYVDGQDLSHFVKANGPVTISQAVNIISQAAEGLAFAHDQGIVHRDIKPGNLLLDKQGVVRILDMGLARMRPAPGDSLAGGAHADLTNTGSVMGTIDYMAPEQALDAKSADHRADIYSLGCTLWFLLSGNPPYREDTIMRRLLAHREQQIPSVRSVLPQAPSELEEILHRMMAKSKDDRFPSMRHLLVALQMLELDDTESEQIATLDMPDDGSGGFIKLPENESFGRPASRTAPLQLTDSQMRHAKPVSSATSAPPSHPDAATVVAPERSEATDATVTFQADQSQITSAPIKSAEEAATPASSASRRKLAMLAIGGLLLAVIAAFAFRGGKPTDRESDPAKVATAKPTPDVPATASNVAIPTPMPPIAVASVSDAVDYDAERKAAEWVLKRGSTLEIYDENGQRLPVEDGKVPTTKFVLNLASLSGRSTPLTDADLLNLAGCRRLGTLDLVSQTKITVAGMRSLAAVKSLWILDVRGTKLGDDFLPHLTNWPRLTNLRIGDYTNPYIVDITDAGLRNLPQLSGLTSLDIGSRTITDEGLTLICERMPNLTSLVLAHHETASLRPLQRLTKLQSVRCFSTHLTDTGVETLQSLPNLEELNIDGDLSSGASISRLGKLRERLVRLTILAQLNANEAPLWKQLSEFTRLSHLLVYPVASSYTGSFSDGDLELLARVPKLQQARIYLPPSSFTFTPAGVAKFRQVRPDVELHINEQQFPATATASVPVSDAIDFAAERNAAEWVLKRGSTLGIHDENGQGIALVDGKLPTTKFVLNLAVLYGKPTPLTDADLLNLAGCRRLKTLDLRNETKITVAGMKSLAAVKSLSQLDVRGTKLGDELLPQLTNWPRLTHLLMGEYTNPYLVEITDAGLRKLPQLPGMTNLDIGSRGFTEEGLMLICERMPNVSHLTIAHHEKASLRPLQRLTKLQNLRCATTHLANAGVEALQSLPNLELMSIDGDLSSAATISRLGSLRERLTALTISAHLNMDDMSLWQQLREFTRLSSLWITPATCIGSFSDDDLENLARIPKLQSAHIYLPPSSFTHTPEGIAKFRQVRPDVGLHLNGQQFPATAAKPNWPAGTPNADTASIDAALKFDGKQSHVRTPLVHGGDTPLTIEFTLLPGPKQHAVISDSEAKGMGIDILGNSISFLAFRRANGKDDYVRITSPRPLVADRTYRVATVYDSGKLRLFVDGKLEASAELKGEYLPSGLPFYLGASPEGEGIDYPMTGTLDEVRFSKVARYQADYTPVARLAADPDTLALYHFDEGAGDILKDSSVNNRNGKIFNPTWVRVDPKSDSTTSPTVPAFTNDILLLGDGFFSRWRAATGTAALEHIFPESTLNNSAVATSAVATVLDDLRNQKFAAVVPKVVIVQAGYADISRNVPLPESAENYRQLVNQLRHEFPASALVLTSVLPKSELGEQCKALNKAIQQLADNKTAHYVDLDPVFLDSAGNIQTDLLKGVDLSLAGYRALGAALKPTVERLLSVPAAKPGEPDPAKAPFDAKTARVHQEAWAEHLGTMVETTNSVDTKMVLIPPGEFLMGSTDEQVDAAVKLAEAGSVEAGRIDRIRKSKRPQHRAVVAQPFRMARTEVTIAEFRAFVTDTGYITDAERFGQGNTSSQAITDTTADSKKPFIWKAPGYNFNDTFPVTQVSWNDANAYCRWLSQKEQATYRLPTETEWEFACRAGTSTQYSFGDTASELDQYGWNIGNANSNCHPVATRQANPFGLFDMHGNMEEWCGSKFEEDGPSEKPKDTLPASSTNATYAVRGGHWYHNPAFCRSAYRDLAPPTLRFNTLGFRVVSEISKPAAVPVVVPSSVAKPVAPQPTKAPFGAEQAHVHQVAWAQHLSTQVETSNRVGAKMILIPPGEFLMGSTPEEIAAGLKIVDEAKLPPTAFERSRIPEEQPQHKVTITRPFCIGATEVTVGQFRRFVDATKYLTQGEQFGAGNASTWTAPKDSKPENVQITWRTPGYSTTDEHPVTQVTWGDAVAYCNWLSEEELLEPCYESSGKLDWKLIPGANGYRLPTEAEWEYACRAGTTTQFSFGDQASHIGEHGWTGEVKAGHPQPVARKLPNPFGLFDMHGNTREWCHDWYSSEVYAEPSRVDPIGSEFGTDRVMRGGRWNAHSVSARSAFRYDINPFLRNTQGGFRVVRSPYSPPNATTILISPDYEWSEPQNLGAAVNSSQSDANPFLTPDGLTLIFSSNRAQGQSGLDLWESRRASVEESFQTSTNLPRVVNSFATDDSPSLSADGLQMVFASDRPGSEGELDLYLCRRADPQAKWGPPVPLNPPVNTDQREECGAFSPDGLTLYFASNRPNGLGATDIWSARRSSLSDPFGPPENLGSTVNSADDETHFRPTADGRGAVLCRRASDGRHSLWLVLWKGQKGPLGTARMLDPIAGGDGSVRSPGISADGRMLYFQAKRDGGQGDFDLWFVRRVPKSKTEPTPRNTR